MKSLLVQIAIAFSLTLTGFASARQDPNQHIVITQSQTDPDVLDLVDIDQADVREALRKVFRAIGVSYSIAPEIQGTVTVTLRRVSVANALQNILKQVDATYRIEGGVYEIFHRGGNYPVTPGYSSGFIVKLESPAATFEGTLQQLRRCGLAYVVEGGEFFALGTRHEHVARIEEVTARSRTQGNTVAQDNDFRYNLIGTKLEKIRKTDLKVVAVCNLLWQSNSSAAPSHAIVEADPNNGQLLRKVDFFHVDVREALEKLFKVVGVPYFVDPGVVGTVDLQLENVHFETALQAVVKKVKATYRAQPGYHIMLAEDQPGSQIRLLEVRAGTGLSVESLLSSGVRYRVEAGVYSLLDDKGQVVATLEPVVEDTPPSSVTQDGDFLHIVLGSQTFDVRKSDFKVVGG